MQDGVGFPKIYWMGVECDYNVMVMELLGPSLEDLFNFCSRQFSLKTIILLADQMLDRLQYLHEANYIHRDLKPDNFLIGLNEKKNLLHIIDFGLAKRYRCSETFTHISYKENKHLTGTARYASLNTHRGIEQSRRDDIEALGYVLIYFMRGSLPWQGIAASTKNQKYEKIFNAKCNYTLKDLCNHNQIFIKYMEYARSMKFEETPDYYYLRSLFREEYRKRNYPCTNYDWSLIVKHNTEKRGDDLIAESSKYLKKSDSTVNTNIFIDF